MTMKLIATVNLDSGNTSGNTGLTLTNIPQTYKDLLLIGSIRSARTTYETDGIGFALNENTSTYAYIGLGSNASSVANLNTTYESFWAGMQPAVQNSTSVFNNFEIYIPNYRSAFNKSYLQNSAANNYISSAYASQISHTTNVYTTNTNVVTSLRIQSATGSGMAQYSAIWLYGIN